MSNLSDINKKDNLSTLEDDDYFSRTEYGSLMSKCSSMNDFRSIVNDLDMLKNLSPNNNHDLNYLSSDSFRDSFMDNDDLFKTINFENEDCFSINSSIEKLGIEGGVGDIFSIDLDKLKINVPEHEKVNLKDFTRSKVNPDFRKCINVILG